MKPAVNSSWTKYNYHQVAQARTAWWALKVPNYVWLAMMITAAAALSFTTIAREREEVRRAQTAYSQTEGQAKQAQSQNEQLRAGIKGLKNDRRALDRAAQDRLNYVRPNEIVVSPR